MLPVVHLRWKELVAVEGSRLYLDQIEGAIVEGEINNRKGA